MSTSMTARSDDLAVAVSSERQWDRLMRMAAIGAVEETGVNRPCLGPLDRQARRLLIEWGEAAGAQASVDAAGNLWLRREGCDAALPAALTGSHMDSQPRGGRFDGIYGVIAGLEVLAALEDRGIATRRPVELVAWTNEEGGRFAPGCMGSMAWAGHTPIEAFAEVRDAEGTSFGAALAEQLHSEGDLPRRPLGGRPHAYLEAHIEQGPVLEAAGEQLGAVSTIQGARWFTVSIEGATAHAGTAPLSTRRDALQDAVRIINALNEAMADPEDVLRFTVGRLEITPGTSNSVAGHVLFTIDLRHPDAGILRDRGDAVGPTIQHVSRCRASLREVFHAEPTAFAPRIVALVGEAAAHEGLRWRRMPSGAFHDAQFVSRVCPAGMIFVPCRDGISHNVAEYAAPQDLAAGTRVLARALLSLADED